MKKVSAFLSLLSAIALAGCSSDEPAGDEKGSGNNDCGYVAVNIVQPKSMGSRAATGFQDGTESENSAKTATFFIFDANGKNGTVIERYLDGSGTNTTPAVERLYNVVLVIDGENLTNLTDNGNQTIKMVCVLNAPSSIKNITTLDDLKKKVDNFGSCDPGTFIMSNSAYRDALSNDILSVDIKTTDIATSSAAAQKNPVDIYVERVVAKVHVTEQTSGITNTTGANPAINGVPQKLGIKITGIEIANVANTSYVLKNTSGISSDWDSWVWDAANMRSYWETVPEIGSANNQLSFSNKSYNTIAGNFANVQKEGKIDYTEYIQPNTSDTKTAVLVTAQLMADETNPYKDLAYIRGGYTTINDAKNVVADYLAQQKNYYVKIDDTHYRQLDKTEIQWTNKYIPTGKTEQERIPGLKDYEVVAQVNSGIEIYTREGNKVENGVAQINELLRSDAAKSYRARVYTDGMCYYYVNIDHSKVVDTNTAEGTYVGVVRNHIYELSLQSIQGIGTPVFDPKDVIIPDKPKDEGSFYLAAKINVLAWRIVNQNVNFTGN